MSLEKVINEIIYNLKPIYNEFGFDRNEIDVELIDSEDCDDRNDLLAWTNSVLHYDGHLTYDEILTYKRQCNSSIKFNIEYDKCIYISEMVLFNAVRSRLEYLDVDDNRSEMFKNTTISILEDAILHELRHLYQFKTMKQISLQYVDIYKTSSISTASSGRWCIDLDYEIRYVLERDAINYTHYKKDLTILEDKKLKEYLSIINYNVDLLNSLEDDEDRMIDINNAKNSIRFHYLNKTHSKSSVANKNISLDEEFEDDEDDEIDNNETDTHIKFKNKDGEKIDIATILISLKNKFLANLK